jgi:hypothetical protein
MSKMKRKLKSKVVAKGGGAVKRKQDDNNCNCNTTRCERQKTCQSIPCTPVYMPGGFSHCVALQVAFERQTLKPAFHLIGYRLWV